MPVALSADLQGYVGDLAESWDIAGTSATFKLRQNAKWHDGTPVTAKDIVFTINVLTDPAASSRWGASFRSVVGYAEAQTAETPTSLSGLTAPDDYTVQIELTQPDSGLLAGFFFINILPEHILGAVPRAELPEQSFWTEGRIGAGPFKFVRLVEGERIELEAFPDYHHGAPQISKLKWSYRPARRPPGAPATSCITTTPTSGRSPASANPNEVAPAPPSPRKRGEGGWGG